MLYIFLDTSVFLNAYRLAQPQSSMVKEDRYERKNQF
jgi:hypothetical protein